MKTQNPFSLDEQKEILESLEQELVARLANLNADLTQSHSADSGEQAVERENDEVVASLQHESEQELIKVRHALARIKAGAYEECEKCGEPINPARLQALPFAALCIKCAE